jgi:hypothetical protein
MSFIARISTDIHNVRNCYQHAWQPPNEPIVPADHPDRLPAFCYYPVILECVMLTFLTIAIPHGAYRLRIGTLYWDEYRGLLSWQIRVLKHSPVVIAATLTLAAMHSKKTLAAVVGAYVIKKLIP